MWSYSCLREIFTAVEREWKAASRLINSGAMPGAWREILAGTGQLPCRLLSQLSADGPQTCPVAASPGKPGGMGAGGASPRAAEVHKHPPSVTRRSPSRPGATIPDARLALRRPRGGQFGQFQRGWYEVGAGHHSAVRLPDASYR